MPTLSKEYRKQLEKAVLAAREEAERGAFEALNSLGLTETKSPPHLSEDQQNFRRRLRARGKQLGDKQTSDKAWDISRLVHETAYEHWHRMLFARFLAKNGFLIEPESGLDVDLDYCEERARETKGDTWEIAAGFAQRMLTAIFRADDPVLQLRLPAESRNRLTALLANLPAEVFTASDSLGWVYQFWQAKRKEEVNNSGNKIGAEELPSVTQLFTEDYMVDFLLDNTLGAWHAGKVLAANPKLAEDAQSEDELREAVSLPGCPWSYLRFVVARPSRSEIEEEQPDRDGLVTFDPSSLAITAGENLPHWTCDHAIYHVSFRLADSVPLSKREEWISERDSLANNAKLANRDLTAHEEERIRFLYSERIEKFLDSGHGLCLLRRPEIAELVAGAIRHFEGERYRLHSWCVMPNHVHVIVEPLPGHDLSKIIHSWKSFTAHEINKRLGQTGDVWQHDAYNHIIRSDKEYRFQIAYVWENPAKAHLSDWKWRWLARPEIARPSRSGIVEELDRDGLATVWSPAAGTFDGWPKTAKELKCLDPCMGSGHFVVAMFERLVALRMAEEKLDEAAAVAAVIRDNLFGLELDPRCTQIGAFNLALAAWRRVGHCALPAMNLACSGLAPNTREADWLAIAGDNQKLQRGMERLYRLFQKAAVLGSLINPRAGEGDLLVAAFHELQPLLEKALAQEAKNDTAHEMAVTARGLAKAAEILAGQFTLVATNVPYLGRPKQDDILTDYCDRVHPEAKADLATCFVERGLAFCAAGGTATLVTPQNWLSQPRYTSLRERALRSVVFDWTFRLGEHAFESPQAAGAFVAIVSLSRSPVKSDQQIAAGDFAEAPSPNAKAQKLLSSPLLALSQATQAKNPEGRIEFSESETTQRLMRYAKSIQGLATSDDPQFTICFWELPAISNGWCGLMGTVLDTVPFGGREQLILWEDGRGRYFRHAMALKEEGRMGGWKSGTEAREKRGVLISQMRQLPVTLYLGEFYDHNACVFIPEDPSHLAAIWAFCESEEFNAGVRTFDQALKPSNNTLTKVSFDLTRWQKVAEEKYPHGLPKPFSSDPTQWLFNGHPADADQPLHVAVARLLDYRWPRQTGSSFPDCPALGPDGLEKHADKDSVVCFSQVRGEPPAADRLRALLADAYGAEWSHAMESKLIAASGSKADSLEDWLLNDFFAQHCDVFHNRPFVWHLWDGRKDGFNVLVNYHKLAGPNGEGHRTLERLTYACLGDWIKRQKDGMARGEAGADDRHDAALELEGQLKKILAGEPPYDLFIRWKPLHQQAIGWEPDINDGVRLNCRPFLAATLTRGKAGAGLFRAKPGTSLKWGKDRGKEPMRAKEDFPWFWNWDERSIDFTGGAEFDGNRWNDCHYTTAAKQAARDAKKENQ